MASIVRPLEGFVPTMWWIVDMQMYTKYIIQVCAGFIFIKVSELRRCDNFSGGMGMF